MKKVSVIAYCALILMVITTGCNSDKNYNYKTKEQPVSLSDFVLGEGTYEKLTVQLVLAEGEYFDIDHTIPGGGVYDDNYQGAYILKVLKNQEVLSSLDLGERNIGGKFTIKFDDYNTDSNIDFTFGDWAGSNNNEFTIYTISNDGKISDIGKIITSEGKNGSDYSVTFEHENNVITTKIYDMEKGENSTTTYTWNTDERKFILNTK